MLQSAWSIIVWAVLVGWLTLTGTQLYYLWFPLTCAEADAAVRAPWCILPRLPVGGRVDVRVFAVDSPKAWPSSAHLAFEKRGFDPQEGLEAAVPMPVAKYGTRNPQSKDLFAHIYFMAHDEGTGEVTPDAKEATGISTSSGKEVLLHYAIVPVTRPLPYRYHTPRHLLQAPAPAADKHAPDSPDAVTEMNEVDSDGGTCADPDADDASGSCSASMEEDSSERQDAGATSARETAAQVATVESPGGGTRSSYEWGKLYGHIRPSIKMRTVDKHPRLRQHGMMVDLQRSFQRTSEGGMVYGPLLELDETTLLKRHWRLLSTNISRADPTVQLSIQPMSLGMFRTMSQIETVFKHMQTLWGIPEQDVEDIKEMLVEMGWSWRMWAMTTVVGTLHSVFAFLAFKNDVGFWKARTSLEGLSVRTFFSSFVCQLIILLKLLDAPNVSNIIRLEVGVGVLIEGWKVMKIAKRRGMLHLEFWLKKKEDRVVKVSMTRLEADTDDYDRKAMRVLGMVLYPVVLGWAIYTLLYHHHRSWWSWVVSVLANGVYMFGFIAMTPQLYINYRLKSVAHLPWRVFMYKVRTSPGKVKAIERRVEALGLASKFVFETKRRL